MTDMQIIELSEVDGDRKFPIVIGLPEAFAIERRLKGFDVPRPQTHDLLASTIRQLGGRLKEIVINDLREGTFYATLVIDQDGQEVEIDSRPSDAIALGIAEEVPIFVAEHVLAQTESDAAATFDAPLNEFEVSDEEDDDDDDEGEKERNWD